MITYFSREDIEIDNRYMKRCHHYSPSRKYKSKPQWAIISYLQEWPLSKTKQTNNNKWQMLVSRWRKGNHYALLVQMQIFAASMENSMQVHQKVKNRATIWSRNPTSEYIPKENKNRILRRLHTHVHYNIVHNSQECSLTEHTHKYYSAIKKTEFLPFATSWIGFEGVMLSEVSQKDRAEYFMVFAMVSFTSGISCWCLAETNAIL